MQNSIALRLSKGQGSRNWSAQALPQGTISFQFLQLCVFWGGMILTLNLQAAPTHSAPQILFYTKLYVNYKSSLKAQVWPTNGLWMFQCFHRSEMMGTQSPPQTSRGPQEYAL